MEVGGVGEEAGDDALADRVHVRRRRRGNLVPPHGPQHLNKIVLLKVVEKRSMLGLRESRHLPPYGKGEKSHNLALTFISFLRIEVSGARLTTG